MLVYKTIYISNSYQFIQLISSSAFEAIFFQDIAEYMNYLFKKTSRTFPHFFHFFFFISTIVSITLGVFVFQISSDTNNKNRTHQTV